VRTRGLVATESASIPVPRIGRTWNAFGLPSRSTPAECGVSVSSQGSKWEGSIKIFILDLHHDDVTLAIGEKYLPSAAYDDERRHGFLALGFHLKGQIAAIAVYGFLLNEDFPRKVYLHELVF
jgi:hypothetical protein